MIDFLSICCQLLLLYVLITEINLTHTHIQNKEIVLVTELVPGGELFDKIVEIGAYSEGDAANIVKQVVEVSIRFVACDHFLVPIPNQLTNQLQSIN